MEKVLRKLFYGVVEPERFEEMVEAGDERDMLDAAVVGRAATFRPGCRIRITKALDDITVQPPAGTTSFRRLALSAEAGPMCTPWRGALAAQRRHEEGKMDLWRRASVVFLASIGMAVVAASAQAEKALRVVMHSDLKIVDPIWTTAYIVRNHGYMIYDMLFATDAQGNIKPQMLERHEVSGNQLVHTFTLRDGLLWHNGKPVTADDCVASIRRWMAKDTTGQKQLAFVDRLEVADDKTFLLRLKEPSGLVLIGLGKASSNVPFMMPKHVAETDPNTQISDFTGSGPFVFKRDEWKPGDKTVYVKFARYKPRSEPASGLAGGKLVKVDRVEWRAIPEHQQAVAALQAGEIDFIEQPPHDLLPIIKADKALKIVDFNVLGSQFSFRPNWLHKPFDNYKVRQALLYAFNQDDFLKAVVGDPQYYRVCKSYFVCGTAFQSDKGMGGLLGSNFDKARALLKEADYDGTPIVLLHATDVQIIANLAPVAKALMERAGFKVDMQPVDWQTLVARRARKDPPQAGGWHAFLTSWFSVDVLNPIFTAFLNAGCEKAPFGWPCDAEMEKPREDFARETDPVRQKEIADKVQVRATEIVTHIPLGQTYLGAAMRKNVNGMVVAPVPVFWNLSVD
jgi:peptide/nickel transport system substrate-binding protein